MITITMKGCLLEALTVSELVGKLKLATVPVLEVKYCRQPSGPARAHNSSLIPEEVKPFKDRM